MSRQLTANLKLPYYQGGDPADGATQQQDLATVLDGSGLLRAPAVSLSSQAVLDVGMAGQVRAGRALTVADFTAMGLAQPLGLFNLSDLTNLGSDGRALTNKGTVPFAPGINGTATTAAQFAGSTGQALYIVDSGAADPYRIRTGSWGCWFRTAKRATGNQALMSRIGSAGNYGWQIYVSAANVAWGQVSLDGSAVVAATGATDVADDRWHHVVTTADGAMLRLYLDGALEATAAAIGTIFPSSAPLNVGGTGGDASTVAASPHYGRVDEAFVTADVLSEDQVRNLYCAKIPHALAAIPTRVNLNVRRRKKGGALVPADFPTSPVRLHNFTAGSLVDEGTGAVTLTNNGTAVSVAGADGTSGGAFSFAGAQSLSSTDAAMPAALTSRSSGIWFKTRTAATMVMLEWGTPVTADSKLYMDVLGGLGHVSGADVLLSSAYVPDGAWHQAVAVEDNTAGDGLKRKLYLDGRLIASTTVLTSLTLAGANRFRLGQQSDATAAFTGQLDGAFVCAYALTYEQVASLYAKGSQALVISPKSPGAHVEAMDASNVLATFDTLDSQHMIDLGVAS